MDTLLVSGFWFGLYSLLYIFFAFRVIRLRWLDGVGMGVGNSSRLQKATRVHGNSAEYLPFILLLVAALELRGVASFYLHMLYAIAFVGRVLVLIGFTKTRKFSPQRFLGMTLTLGTLSGAAIGHIVMSINSGVFLSAMLMNF